MILYLTGGYFITMKKTILTLLCCTMLVTTVSCNKKNPINLDNTDIKNKIIDSPSLKNDDTTKILAIDRQTAPISSNSGTQSAEKVYSTQELIEKLEISDLFASILRCEEMFYNTNEGVYMYLRDYKYAYDYISEWKTISVAMIDMDGNGQNEMLVEGLHDIVVFREFEGEIYSYGFTFRSMNSIREDGTFLWAEKAGKIYGSSKLQFDRTVHRCIELYRVEHHGTENAKYYINENEVTLTEMQSYGERTLANKVNWYSWNKNTIKNPTHSDNQPNGK
jgi:hypothetical protein